MTSNSDVIKARIAELRRKVTANKGVYYRRSDAITLAQADMNRARRAVRDAQIEIANLGGKVRDPW